MVTRSVAMPALQKCMFLWRLTKEVKMLCPTRFFVDAPTRFVVDATENSEEEGVAAEVYSSQTGL